jgi:hypothetical protein
MLSFIILVLLYLIPCIYFFFNDIKENKLGIKWIIAIILLIIAIYLKSINM